VLELGCGSAGVVSGLPAEAQFSGTVNTEFQEMLRKEMTDSLVG